MKQGQQLMVRQKKPKFVSEYVEGHQIQTEHSIQVEQEQAYEELMTNWKFRQRQSLMKNINGDINGTLYTYDPNNPDFSTLQKPISEERQDLFSKFTPEICKYLNAKFIVEEIIDPMRDSKIFDEEQLQNVQLFYMLSFRAWCEINTVLRTFNQKKYILKNKQRNSSYKRMKSIEKIEFVFNPDDMNLKYLVEPMIKLSTKIDVVFEFYHRTLTMKELYIKNKIKAFFQFIFKNKIKKTHDKFLCGFQGIDFTREEQIDYLNDNYIKVAIDQIKGFHQSKYDGVVEKLSIFKQLLLSKYNKIEGYDDIEILKKSLIKQWKQKQKYKNEVTPSHS